MNWSNEIEQFFVAVQESEEYKAVEYLSFSIRKSILEYLERFRLKDFILPAFLCPLSKQISKLFHELNLSSDNMLAYMLENDTNHWVYYYDSVLLRPVNTKDTNRSNTVLCEENKFFFVLTGFILDRFSKKRILDINELCRQEQFVYPINQYGLTKVSEIQFKRDSFIFDGKAYLYNILTNISVINFTDEIPGFAKIIVDEIKDGDVLIRVDERLALPADQIINYSTLCFDKFRGPSFDFNNLTFDETKTIIVHYDHETYDKLLMVIKRDYDSVRNRSFFHIEVETLPCPNSLCQTNHYLTTFLHGMFYPQDGCFVHIDCAVNQYENVAYEKKYSDSSHGVPIDYHAEKKLHYKLWCIENGKYSRTVWYKMIMVSLPNRFRSLFKEFFE